MAPSVRVLEALSHGFPGGVAARFWNGGTWQAGPPAAFTLVLKHPGAARAMFWPFDRVALGESYVFDDFDIEGDIIAFVAWMRFLLNKLNGLSLPAKLRILGLLMKVPKQRNPRDTAKIGRPRSAGQDNEADRRGISIHYDRPSAFYRLFLSSAMQ
ncbi:MAG: SAM-dependent methyltransferase, partial [Gemmataceae bacterium]